MSFASSIRVTAHILIWLHQEHILQGTVSELLTPENVEEILDLEMN